MSAAPSRGEIWIVDLEPVRGHEQGRTRPALVVSVDSFNAGPAELVIVVPLTTVDKQIPTHIMINPPEGGVNRKSFAKCEDIRSISTERLSNRIGRVSSSTLERVENALIILLDLDVEI